MGYRPDNQSLEPAIEAILAGFEKFNSATKQRIESREWADTHIQELNELRKKFLEIQIELEKLNEDTW